MPCVEVADAIVQTGRETLERVSLYRSWANRKVPADGVLARPGEAHYREPS